MYSQGLKGCFYSQPVRCTCIWNSISNVRWKAGKQSVYLPHRKLENKLPSIEDRGQTDRVTVLANSTWLMTSTLNPRQPIHTRAKKSTSEVSYRVERDGRTQPIAFPGPLTRSVWKTKKIRKQNKKNKPRPYMLRSQWLCQAVEHSYSDECRERTQPLLIPWFIHSVVKKSLRWFLKVQIQNAWK